MPTWVQRTGGDCYFPTSSSINTATYSATNYCSSTTTTTTTIITTQPIISWYYIYDDPDQTAATTPITSQTTATHRIVWNTTPAVIMEYPAVLRRPRQMTAEQIALRDQEQYQRAIAEHDLQEADRIARMIAEREQRQEQQRAAQAELQAQRMTSNQRAREFLLEHLNPQQRETFEKNDWFIVEGGRSKKQYRIRAVESMIANVDVLDNERMVHRLCGHIPTSRVPLGDQLLAQKMMLEFSEDDFLRIANRH